MTMNLFTVELFTLTLMPLSNLDECVSAGENRAKVKKKRKP